MQLTRATVRTAVLAALAEDQSADDVTTRWSVPAALQVEATMIAKQPGRVAGLPALREVYATIDPTVTVRPAVADGDPVLPGQPLAWISGAAQSIITGERVALNFVQRMSGIATLTAAFVAAIGARPVRLLDTRKTAPGLRAMDKYAVSCGGGTNHRLDLAAMVLLKENHLAAAGGVPAAVRRVRDGMTGEGRGMAIEVEVTTAEEAREALDCQVEWLLLDNMSAEEMATIVEWRNTSGSTSQLEASGTVTLDTVAEVAATGVDAVSVGALTHSPTALDISLLVTRDHELN
ncbi:carboxylating nicotinate-nucleotide diphosphorylase [Kribbella sp. NPDC051952]|uniref:carboxylating nicotinate-nucleotide diphosphorylase n=1 Tax=Kribbella sp. NPDC051952 TaxID=3154851 RepID=UPI0034161BD3